MAHHRGRHSPRSAWVCLSASLVSDQSEKSKAAGGEADKINQAEEPPTPRNPKSSDPSEHHPFATKGWLSDSVSSVSRQWPRRESVAENALTELAEKNVGGGWCVEEQKTFKDAYVELDETEPTDLRHRMFT